MAIGVLAAASQPAQAADRSGTYTLAAPVSYSCTDTFFGSPVFSGGFSAVVVADAAPSITISEPGPGAGEPGSMSGTLTDPTFSVGKFQVGSCSITQAISGSFTNATTMQASYSISFAGSNCGSTTCINQTLPFVATRPAPPPVPVLPMSLELILAAALGALSLRRASARVRRPLLRR